jgi:hypothetical protein
MARVRAAVGTVLGLLSLGVSPAVAQTPISVGYSTLHVLERNGYDLPVGLLITAGGDSNRIVSPLLEVGINYSAESRQTLQIVTAQGGVRVVPYSGTRVRPFGQVMGGVIGAQCCGEMAMRFAVEPGGGVEFPLTRRLSAQVIAGFPLVIAEGFSTRLIRISAGVSFVPW